MKIKLNLDKAQDALNRKVHSQAGVILLVDDEPENLDGLSALLSQKYKVHTTTTPHEAIEIVRNHQVDLVISDQRMPEMLGTELLAHLRQIAPQQVRILLTGYADIQDLIGCVNQGLLYRYLVKPWIPSDLLNTVQQAFDKLNIERQVKEQAEALEKEVAERRQAQESLEKTLSELKATQEALLVQEKLRALGEMASGVAHDFNNLLTPIYAYCEELILDLSPQDSTLEVPDQKEAMEALYCIRNAVIDGKALIERLRSAYFPKRHSMLPPFSVISVNELLRESIALATPRWSIRTKEDLCEIPAPLTFQSSSSESVSHNLTQQVQSLEWHTQSESLKISCFTQPNLSFYGDKSEIRQAIVNLISNALDAMKDGTDSASLTVKGSSKDEQVMFEIIDNGSGITPEVLEHCREQFYSTKGEHGSGIGLHMVHLCAEKHGGQLELDSEVNVGTTARLILPLRPQHLKRV